MRVADYIFKTLADRGCDTVFMVSGGGAMFLNDALGCEKRLRMICAHHEQGAAIAADGYARTSGKMAVVSVTTGPGGTNALTGLIGEWLDSQPVLYLSGQVKFPTCSASCPQLKLRQLGDQEINIIDLVRPVTKYASMVTDPRSIRRELETAMRLACSGRPGPVWLDIPINVQSAEIDPETLPGTGLPEIVPPAPSDAEIAAVASALKRAEAPVLIAGHGIRLAGAIDHCRELFTRYNIPVLSTFNGFDMFPSSLPQLIGRIGTIGDRAGNIALQNADCVLSIGSRNNLRQISYNYENFAKRAKDFILIDVDPAELEKPTLHPTGKIRADAGIFLQKLLKYLEKDGLPDYSDWLDWNRQRKLRYPAALPEYENCSDGVSPYFFTRLLTELLPANTVLGCANATPSIALFQAGVVKANQRMIVNSGCAAMGFGLPAAMGAAFAAPGRTAVCLDGDGSLMMNLQELQTVAHHHLPLKLFLYNNHEYASIRQTQDNFFSGRHSGCDFDSGVSFPDWKLLAGAFRWDYEELHSAAEAREKLPEILHRSGPVFCNVFLPEKYVFSPKLSSRKLPDGTLVSPSLEDMYPFLPAGEKAANVYPLKKEEK